MTKVLQSLANESLMQPLIPAPSPTVELDCRDIRANVCSNDWRHYSAVTIHEL